MPKKVYNLKSLPIEKRPRERLIDKGPDVLKNYELLAIVLNTGYKDETVLDLTHRILQDYGSKAITKEKSVIRLMEEVGIPEMKACQIISCFELGRRFFMEDTGRMPTIQSPEDVYNYLIDMRKLKKEHFRGLYLNSRNKLIHDEVISIGTLTANLVHPREVFSPAIEFASVGVVLAHNHPSGDPEPSEDDLTITKRLVEAGKLFGIDILDHIIVAKDNFVSLKEKGII
ncbi:DNA repair protein RadC [Patescibacteria group bacterium]|nr:DNA repair protein RadC [Patescibacteria group bacterium]MBU4482435.1 DNA repair protein RadC [Patescibacteria group bacterium]